MRSTFFASCLLALSFAVVGCDDGMKKDATPATEPSAPAVSAPADAGKACDGSPKGGAMEAAPKALAPMEAAPAPTPEPKKEE